MNEQLCYLMTSLPPLSGLDDAPPITMEGFLSSVRLEGGETVLALAEAFDAVEQTRRVAENRASGHAREETRSARRVAHDLPPVMAQVLSQSSQEAGEDFWITQLWRECFSYLKSIGQTVGSSLLVSWSAWEGTLREELMSVRRKSAGGEASSRAGAAQHSGLISEWSKAADPLAGERLLDEARIKFIDAGAARYSFRIDELVAYFLKLSLLLRHAALDREVGAGIIREVTAL